MSGNKAFKTAAIKRIKLILVFYRRLLLPMMLLSAISCYIVWKAGLGTILTILIWFKLLSNAVIFYLLKEYKRNEHYFFYNLGLNPFLLGIGIFVFDMVLFGILVFFTAKLAQS